MKIPAICPFCKNNQLTITDHYTLGILHECRLCLNFYFFIENDKITFLHFYIIPYLLESGEEGLTITSIDNCDMETKEIFIKQFLLPESLDYQDLEKFLNRLLNLNIYS